MLPHARLATPRTLTTANSTDLASTPLLNIVLGQDPIHSVNDSKGTVYILPLSSTLWYNLHII